MEIDDFQNHTRYFDFEQACYDWELMPGTWETWPAVGKTRQNLEKFTPPCWALEGERDIDFHGIIDELSTSIFMDLPHALVTNFGGQLTQLDVIDGKQVTNVAKTKAYCRTLVEAGFRCMPECDLPVNPRAQPDAMTWEAWWRGWDGQFFPSAQPVAYAYGGKTLADYERLNAYHCWGAWSAEYLLGW